MKTRHLIIALISAFQLFSFSASSFGSGYFGKAPYLDKPSGGGGNATVPNDAPIQPPQAFVDALKWLSLNYDVSAVDCTINFSGTAITSVANSFLTGLENQAGNRSSANWNFSACAIDVASVNRILAAGVAALGQGAAGTIDLSGGTNAAPTLPVFVIDFNNLDISTNDIVQHGTAGNSPVIVIDSLDGTLNSLTVIDWSSNGSGFLLVGTSDSPTKQQIIDKLVALGSGKIVDLGGLKIRVSPTDYSLEPLDFTGMTGSSLTQGNNDIGTLRVAGWTVTTNAAIAPALWALTMLVISTRKRVT